MISFSRPTDNKILAHQIRQSKQPFTYDAVGATATSPPPGFDCDRERVQLGHGADVFQLACDSIRSWRMFPTRMCQLYWPDREIREGAVVDVLFRGGPLWFLNSCRIVYVIDEPHRFGFAYGTLPDHVESGEERFLVEWDPTTDQVHYEVYAFSFPRHWLARIGYFWARREQARFRRLSAQAMLDAVANQDAP